MHDLSKDRDTKKRTQGRRGGRSERTGEMSGWTGQECRGRDEEGE
jgi:hypothetical protein